MLSLILIKSWQKWKSEYSMLKFSNAFWIATLDQCLYDWKISTSKDCIQWVKWNINENERI